MKILLITDQHFGVRNDNQHFINHYKKFYSEIVIPFIKASGIKQVLCLGDTFDRRRFINFMSLNESKEMWFDPLKDMGIIQSIVESRLKLKQFGLKGEPTIECHFDAKTESRSECAPDIVARVRNARKG